MAKEIGFHVTVADARPAYAPAARFPEADAVVVVRAEEIAALGLNPGTTVVVMSHNYLTDCAFLKAALPLQLRYLGLMGPRARALQMVEELRLGGLESADDVLGRIHNPVGLDIGAENPEQIALAILAEIQAVMAGRPGGSLREKKGPIHAPPDSPHPPDKAGCALILLAAGASSRLGRPKQLLVFRGRSLLRHAAETALASVCRPVVVVLGASADRLQTELTALPVTVALNPASAEGMGKSIRAGLREVLSDTAGPDAVVIMLCDQPLITTAMLDRLVSVHRSTGRGIAASEYEGALGAPALFARRYYPESWARWKGDQGARRIFVKHAEVLARISLPKAAFDVDRVEEAARLESSGG